VARTKPQRHFGYTRRHITTDPTTHQSTRNLSSCEDPVRGWHSGTVLPPRSTASRLPTRLSAQVSCLSCQVIKKETWWQVKTRRNEAGIIIVIRQRDASPLNINPRNAPPHPDGFNPGTLPVRRSAGPLFLFCQVSRKSPSSRMLS
jgi:hypothetical protein